MTQESKKINYTKRITGFAKYYAKVFEEISIGLLGVIPNGLEQIYDYGFKRLPLWGRLFRHRWIEHVFKLCFGITIAQGLAFDIGKFIFWPIGFCVGALIGMGTLSHCVIPIYQAQIRKFFYKLSFYPVSGFIIGWVSAWHLYYNFANLHDYSQAYIQLLGAGIGASLGVLIYFGYLAVLTFVTMNQTEIFRENVNVAKKLGLKLKEAIKQNAKGRILVHAQDIIQQMNGAQAQAHMSEFFENEFDTIVQSTHKKIDRHFNYLTARACHGDNQAFQRLQTLCNKKGDQDKLLERIFNVRAIAKIKDEVDTSYDRWYYQFLKA